MDKIFKEYKYQIENEASDEYFEEISLITYLANLTEDQIITNEIDIASNILHSALRNVYDDYCNVMQSILENEKSYIILKEKYSGNNFKIFLRNSWLFHIILVNSLKYSQIINNDSSSDSDFIILIIGHIIKSTIIIKPLSSYLLKILLLIVTKRKDILLPNLVHPILNHMNEVSLSPITIIRQHAREISKTVISSLPTENSILLDTSLLPIRGIDMCDIVKHLPNWYIRKNQHNIVEKVLRMFKKNVESKDGGMLYECLLFYSFDNWKREIWPLFLVHLKHTDYEGEFFQSLLKYWMPINVSAYKSEFYNFLRNEPISLTVQGYVLLESRKKGYIIDDELMEKDILSIFTNAETRTLGLRLATTFHKKSCVVWLNEYEINIVMNYLYSNINTSLEEEEVKSLSLFFSQILLNAHYELLKNNQDISRYMSVMERIYKYCVACLKTDFYEVGAQVAYILSIVAAGSHKSLVLSYRLEKKDFYLQGQNLFYRRLKEKNGWWYDSDSFKVEFIKSFFNAQGCSTHLTKLFMHLKESKNFYRVDLNEITKKVCVNMVFDSEKSIKNYAEIAYRIEDCSKINLKFLEEIHDFVINLSIQERISEENIFKTVLYLEIIMVALKYKRYDFKKLNLLIEKSLCLANCIINYHSSSADGCYKRTKVLEAFINKVMTCLIENIDNMWETINKENVVEQLILIIQRSNMKRPLSLSVEVLKRIGFKMNENELDKDFKTHLLNKTLQSLYEAADRSDVKIRRNPETRLVIHALCSSETSPHKVIKSYVSTIQGTYLPWKPTNIKKNLPDNITLFLFGIFIYVPCIAAAMACITCRKQLQEIAMLREPFLMPLIKWVSTYLVEFISNPNASDAAVASALHTLEILISDSNLQNPTLPFISDIVIQSVELFAKSSWIVRNADLQLTRAIIDRFYGVCLDVCNRPKCVEDLFVLFPSLSPYFYKILSSDQLDERAMLVFQFFSESQTREDTLSSESHKDSSMPFLQLFMDILQKYSNHYGKMAARSFSALCASKQIPKEICSIICYFKLNFRFLAKNIFSNFVCVIQQLHDKYKNSFHSSINSEGMRVINFALNDLLEDVRKCDTAFFNFILFKVKPQNVVLEEFADNLNLADYQIRLWLHNNMPFLLINTKPADISNVLRTVLLEKLPSSIQVKILTILISKFEHNNFKEDTLHRILEILFEASFTVDDTDNYLLNCYFKTILIFFKCCNWSNFKLKFKRFKVGRNIYKIMILVLYLSGRTEELNLFDQRFFFNIVETNYFHFVFENDEMKNDIISTLPYLQKEAPKQFRLRIFKLIFDSSLFISTYYEAFKCINAISNKRYSDILSALIGLFSVKNLFGFLKDKVLVENFFYSVLKYIPIHFQHLKSVGYYTEESDILVPKLFLERIIHEEIQKIEFL